MQGDPGGDRYQAGDQAGRGDGGHDHRDRLLRCHADCLEHAEVVHALPGHEHDGVQHAKTRDDHQ